VSRKNPNPGPTAWPNVVIGQIVVDRRLAKQVCPRQSPLGAWSLGRQAGRAQSCRTLHGLELQVDVTRRRATPSERIQALTDTNAALQAKNAQLERTSADLKAANDNLEHKIKSLQVAVTILLASSGGLGVGLAVSMAGAAVQTALASATGVFFAVIMASIAILTFMRR